MCWLEKKYADVISEMSSYMIRDILPFRYGCTSVCGGIFEHVDYITFQVVTFIQDCSGNSKMDASEQKVVISLLFF